MNNPVVFAKRVFLIAGIYGLLAALPLYFSEHPTGIHYPPDITHPEWYYGFAGVVSAWAILFIVLSRDPLRYRPMMIPSIIEKLSFPPAVLILFLQGRIPDSFLPLALIDSLFAVAFFIAYKKTKPAEQS